MIGIVIAGGPGTRLRPLTYRRPKHLLPLVNRPFLEYQIALLKTHRIRDIVFATNYMAEMIQAHFGDGSAFGVNLSYAVESEPLGTGGAIRNAADSMRPESALVLNGDILTDYDLTRLIATHRQRVEQYGAEASLTVIEVARPHPYGIIRTYENSRINYWHEPTEAEKRQALSPGPRPNAEAEQKSDYINAGIYLLERPFIERIPTGCPVSIERETLPAAIAKNEPVFAEPSEGGWLDIGAPIHYLVASRKLLENQISTDLSLNSVAITADIAEDALIQESSLGERTKVGTGSRLRGCIILDGVHIGNNVQLDNTIADVGSVIEDDVCLRMPVVLAAGSRIARGSLA